MALGKVPGTEDDAAGEGVFAEINITPLTDIFLVLLIIFMVTSTVIVRRDSGGGAQAGLKVNLPKGGAADVRAKPADLPVAILSDGRLVVEGKVVDAPELKKTFDETKEKNPETLVIVQADEGVPHGRVVEVMEAARAAGLAQLAIGVRDGAGGK